MAQKIQQSCISMELVVPTGKTSDKLVIEVLNDIVDSIVEENNLIKSDQESDWVLETCTVPCPGEGTDKCVSIS